MVDVLLASGDALKAQLGRHQGSSSEVIDTSDLLANIRALVAGETPVAVVATPTVAQNSREQELEAAANAHAEKILSTPSRAIAHTLAR